MEEEKGKVPVAYIIAGAVAIIMIALVVWQFTLPETEPLVVMSILFVGGCVSLNIVCAHVVNTSYTPFQAVSIPLGLMLVWGALVIMGGGIWISVLESAWLPGVVTAATAALLGFGAYIVIKD